MSILLSEYQKELYESAKAFALEHIAPYAYEWEVGKRSVKEAFELFSVHGYCGLLIPKVMGGKGYSYLETALIYEGLAHGSGTMAFMLQLHNNITFEIATFYDTSDEVKSLLSSMISGEKLTAFAFTEKESGSDAASINAYASLESDGYHIHGEKVWIANAADAEHINVIVRNGQGNRDMMMLLVDRDTPGLEISESIERFGGNVISCCNLSFDDCVVPESRLLSTKGFKEALRAIDVARIFVPAIALGMATSAVDATSVYLDRREAFGQPILANQGIQWSLAEMAARIEAGKWMVYHCASLMDAGEQIGTKAAMNKLYATELAMEVSVKCLQYHGANGFAANSKMVRMVTDAKMFEIVDGTVEIQKLIIGRDIQKKVSSHK